MAKFSLFLSIILLTVWPAKASLPLPMIASTYQAAVDCMYSAAEGGSSQERFLDSEDWVRSIDDDGFQHRDLPIIVRFPFDHNGISKTCEVEATMASTLQQSALIDQFRAAFGKPFEQSNSSIWMVETADGLRGLQVFPDNDSKEPKVKLIGAAF